MAEKNKITFEETVKLIRLKHSEIFINSFLKAEGNTFKMSEVWEQIASEFENKFTTKFLNSKYNQMLMKYKSERIKSEKSGAGASSWKYWSVFFETFPKDKKIKMANVEEFGDGSVVECKSFPNKTEKKPVRKQSADITNEVMVKFLEVLEKENAETNNDKRNFDALEKKMKKRARKDKKTIENMINEKFNEIKDLLQKKD